MHTLSDLNEERTKELLRGVFIPSSPAVLGELMTELRQPMSNGKKVSALINRDPGLAGGVLKSANSPLFGSTRPLSSIADAVKLLGFATLGNLVLETLLRTSIRCHDNSLERFWDNSVHAAVVNARVARLFKGVRPDTAYTFGLLHDCGIPLLVQRFTNYKDVLKLANQPNDQNFTQIEEQALDTNHAIIGCILARSWGLPDTLSEAILCHHDYSVLDGHAHIAEESRYLIAINVIAEHAVGIHLRLTEDGEWLKARPAIGDFLGLSPTELDDIVEDQLFKLDSERNRECA